MTASARMPSLKAITPFEFAALSLSVQYRISSPLQQSRLNAIPNIIPTPTPLRHPSQSWSNSTAVTLYKLVFLLEKKSLTCNREDLHPLRRGERGAHKCPIEMLRDLSCSFARGTKCGLRGEWGGNGYKIYVWIRGLLWNVGRTCVPLKCWGTCHVNRVRVHIFVANISLNAFKLNRNSSSVTKVKFCEVGQNIEWQA